jgi:hypothetical protein
MLKKRYDINKTTIKKIIKIYDLSTYNLFTGPLIEKDKFKEALDTYIEKDRHNMRKKP